MNSVEDSKYYYVELNEIMGATGDATTGGLPGEGPHAAEKNAETLIPAGKLAQPTAVDVWCSDEIWILLDDAGCREGADEGHLVARWGRGPPTR